MNSDSRFLIGHSHHICEDYALSGRCDGFQYAIISDGCSSSKDVDIGARILAKSAEKVIHTISHYITFQNSLYNMVGDMIISNAAMIVRSMGMDDTVLDSTLLFAICKEERREESTECMLYAYGDGGFSYYDYEGCLHFIDIEFPSGAPFYLSYRLDKKRMVQYKEKFGMQVNIKHTWGNEVEEFTPHLIPYLADVSFTPLINSYVSVMSDGIKTFHNNETIKMVQEFMAFKNSQGEFVKRRMNAIKRRCLREGIVYDDDISMASIYVGA